MGNCKSWVHKQREPSRDLTLAILGLDNAGKTVTAKGLQGDSLDSVAPTVGFSSIEFKFEKHKITLFDLGGGKRIRDIWKNYFSEVYGVVYVVDSSEPERLVECKGVLKNLLQHAKVAGKPVLVLANKQDVQGALDEIDICEYLDLEETVNMNKCPCRVETCSAILGQGKKLDKPIKDGFSWLVGIITSNFEKLDARIRKDVEEMKEKAAQDKKERAERVRKQKEERERIRKENGEDDEDEDGEDPAGGAGDPFRRVSVSEIEKKQKEAKLVKALKSSSGALNESDNNSNKDLPVLSSLSSSHALPPIGRLVSKSESFNDSSDEKLPPSSTPRPNNLATSLDLPPLGSANRSSELLLDKGFSGRRGIGLAPLTPLAPLDHTDLDKKRRKKKKPKRNQTSPCHDEDLRVSSDVSASSSTHNDLLGGHRSLSPTFEHPRSLLRASRSPRLETLEEPESGEEGNYSSPFSKFGIEDGLPELAPEVSSRLGSMPNSAYESVLT